jgi:excisionase family DNA binding protein
MDDRGGPPAPAGAQLEDDVLDVRAAAALLQVGTNALYAACSAGKVPHRRIGKQIRFSRAGLMRWLASCSELGAQEGP